MNIFPKIELKQLLEYPQQGKTCISIFIPTYNTGTEIMQNLIRLRNVLNSIQEQLTSRGMRSPEAIKLLSPIQVLIHDDFFLQNLSDGLAIFLSQDLFRYYRLPYRFRELTIIGERFAVKPLLPILSADGRFYILALSQKQTRLLQCTHHSYRTMVLPDSVPANLADFLKYDTRDRELQYHYHGSSSNIGGEPKIAHGAEVEENVKNNLLRYFHQINQTLHQNILQNEDAPLVLAGVEYLLPIYQKANTYNHFINNIIAGNPEGISPEILLNKAWVIVEPYFTRIRKEAREHYMKLGGSGRTTEDIKKIVIESHRGKVGLLFIADNMEIWGKLNPTAGSVDIHEVMESGDEDLLNLAAAYTLSHRGTVYAGNLEETPCGLPVSALLRY